MENQDFKIVCIVNTEGLRDDVFNDVALDEKPFVTNFLYPNKLGCSENNYLLITKSGTPELKKNVCSQDKWEILLISDSVKDLFNNKNIFTEETLVMYHDTPANSRDSLSSLNIKIYKLGHHSSGDKNGYPRLKQLIEAWDSVHSKFDENKYNSTKQNLINWFGVNDKLKAALEFLHKCLLKESCPADLSILSKKEFTDKDLGKENEDGSIHYLFKKMKESKDDETYIKKLEALRDAVLEKAGVTGEN